MVNSFMVNSFMDSWEIYYVEIVSLLNYFIVENLTPDT